VNNLILSKANYHNRMLNNLEMNRTILNQCQYRTFFGGSKKDKDDTTSPKDDEIKKEEVEEENKEEEIKEKKSKDSTTSSSSSDEVDLTAEDVKKIKALIAEQDQTIETH
jgi:hydroxymethylpyrimidine pyrophosphatase-like HAD family hydrolase